MQTELEILTALLEDHNFRAAIDLIEEMEYDWKQSDCPGGCGELVCECRCGEREEAGAREAYYGSR